MRLLAVDDLLLDLPRFVVLRAIDKGMLLHEHCDTCHQINIDEQRAIFSGMSRTGCCCRCPDWRSK